MSTLPCPKQHWSRFSVLLDEGMDLPEGDREDWLRALESEDAELRPWLAKVLSSAASVNTADFLETTGIPAALLDDFSAGDVLGPYRLVELLGEGGMGRVWRASRADDGPTREVALKLPHAELLAGPFRTRFRRERDVLAGLSHPNIAALYDAGVSAEGHPYLALELVCGQTITAHCKAVGCSLERRVDLLRQMLAALGYAHSRLIVHRDIKPSNVLVTDDGTVKLLDFGIAKLLDGTSEDGQKLTQAASRLATPGYAPPEQMDGGPITVTTDLFAAGVLMFELCTGNHPPRLRADDEALPLASSKADALAGNLPEGVNLRRRLRGDLDAIMAKALSGNPAERYHSADAFARDLRRWQDGLPVSARHIGPAARAAKFVRRNRAAVALGGLLSVALVGGVAGIVWQAHRAEHEAARAVAVKDFMIGLFQQSDPGDSGKRFDTMTARDMLDAGVVRADTDFAAHPGIAIEVLETIANIFDWADESERAEKVYSRRLDVAKAAFGPADPRTIESALALANSQVMFLDEDHAKALLESVRGPVFSAFGPASLQRATWLQSHARVLRATHGSREIALADAAASVAIFERYFPNDRHYHEAMLDLEDYQYDNEDFEGSLATLERLRAHDIATHNYSETDDLVFHTDQASRLEKLGRLKEADAIWFIAEGQSEKLFGKNSLWYLHALTSWAQMIHFEGDRARADKMLEEGLAIGKGGTSPSGQSTSVLRLYGVAMAREGRAAEAVPILEKVLEQTKLHGHDEQNLRRTQGMLGDAYDQVGRTEDARPLLRTAREDWLKYGPVRGSFAQNARERWARFLLDHGDSKGAEAEFRELLAQEARNPEAAASLAHAGLARIALAGGSTDVADRESAAAVESVEAIKAEFDTRARADIWLVRADVLAAEGHRDAALGFAQRAQVAIAVWDAAGSPRAVRVAALLGKLAGDESHL